MLAETMAREYTIKNLTRLDSYTPDRKKLASYVEWRQANPTGTYADYRDWMSRRAK